MARTSTKHRLRPVGAGCFRPVRCLNLRLSKNTSARFVRDARLTGPTPRLPNSEPRTSAHENSRHAGRKCPTIFLGPKGMLRRVKACYAITILHRKNQDCSRFGHFHDSKEKRPVSCSSLANFVYHRLFTLESLKSVSKKFGGQKLSLRRLTKNVRRCRGFLLEMAVRFCVSAMEHNDNTVRRGGEKVIIWLYDKGPALAPCFTSEKKAIYKESIRKFLPSSTSETEKAGRNFKYKNLLLILTEIDGGNRKQVPLMDPVRITRFLCL